MCLQRQEQSSAGGAHTHTKVKGSRAGEPGCASWVEARGEGGGSAKRAAVRQAGSCIRRGASGEAPDAPPSVQTSLYGTKGHGKGVELAARGRGRARGQK